MRAGRGVGAGARGAGARRAAARARPAARAGRPGPSCASTALPAWPRWQTPGWRSASPAAAAPRPRAPARPARRPPPLRAAAPPDPARADRRAYLGGAAATPALASPAPYRAPAAPCSGAPCFGVRATAHCWRTDPISAAREGGGAGRRPAVRQAAERGGARRACGRGAGGRGLAEHGAVGRRERDILRDLAHAVAQHVARVQRRVVLGLHLRARGLGLGDGGS